MEQILQVMLAHHQRKFLSMKDFFFFINDLLDFSKISANKMDYNPEKVHLPSFIHESVNFFQSLLIKKNLKLTIELDKSIDNIFVDQIKLKQILNNFVSNAIKFTPEQGKIKIAIQGETNNNFKIAVSDNGIGIAKQDLKQLFTDFHQVSSGSAKKYPGTGLGLALTRKLVELHGGHVGVESILGKGSTFYATLPIDSQVNNFPITEQLKKYSKPKVLVIEEKSQQRDILIDALENAKFTAITVNDINEILLNPNLLKVDAIILDFFLKDIHNWRILKAIFFSKSNLTHFPTLILVIALEAGNFGFKIQDFLIKPIVPENLISALESAGAGPRLTKTILIVDDDKKIIRLTKKFLNSYGYQVIYKSKKQNILNSIKLENIDVVIIDILSEEVNGLELFFQYLRNSNKNIPIIIWRPEALNEAELTYLKMKIQKIVLKNEDISKSLLSEFEGVTFLNNI